MEDDSDGGAKVEDGLKDLDSGILPREAAIVIKLAFSPLKNSEAKLLLENPPKDKSAQFLRIYLKLEKSTFTVFLNRFEKVRYNYSSYMWLGFSHVIDISVKQEKLRASVNSYKRYSACTHHVSLQ